MTLAVAVPSSGHFAFEDNLHSRNHNSRTKDNFDYSEFLHFVKKPCSIYRDFIKRFFTMLFGISMFKENKITYQTEELIRHLQNLATNLGYLRNSQLISFFAQLLVSL